MIYIKKSKEPPVLIQYKKKKYAHYEGMPREVRAAVKESLLAEQGYLCAYCMRRITADTMTIEHYNCQSQITEQEALDYRIMLAVCLGNRGTQQQKVKWKDMICDAHRMNLPLTVNPQKEDDIKWVKYNGFGEIGSEHEKIHEDLTETLNLNCPAMNLPGNRKRALDALKTYLIKQKRNGMWKSDFLQRVRKKFAEPDDTGRKQEYAGILLYYLDRQLRKYEI